MSDDHFPVDTDHNMADQRAYARIEAAIRYLMAHSRGQPSLEEIAAAVHLSPFHFQRLFSQWAGTSPKRFLQVLTLERGKFLLQQDLPLLEVAAELGLSGSGRLHDHFVQLAAVSPGEYRRGGEGLTLQWGVAGSPFGAMFVAHTGRGICRAAFLPGDDATQELSELQTEWPQARCEQNDALAQELVTRLFSLADNSAGPLSLHVRGTNFQLAVWRALLRIPQGQALSYGQLAQAVGHPGSARAVGNAVGANPVAFVIPCHRVIQQSGALGGYRWGPARKQVIQTWERLRQSSDDR